MLRGALEEVPIGVATLSDDTIRHANAALEAELRSESGQLDGRALKELFDEDSWAVLQAALQRRRAFDGRLRARTLTGEVVQADVHAERYQSEAGAAGFLILRDVSLEMSALSKLVSMLGGAAFRVNVDDRAFEFVSPRIVDLIEIDPLRLMEEPQCLQALISPADQTRLGGIYQQVVRGKEPTAEADVVVRLSEGRTNKLTLRITGRPDTAGVVRHVDGVATSTVAVAPRLSHAPPAAQFSGLSTAMRLLDASNDLLREAAQLTTTATADLRGIKALVVSAGLPTEACEEITSRLDTLGEQLAASNGISRRVRRAMDGRPSQVRLGDLLDNVRVHLLPIFDGRRIEVAAPTARGFQLDTRVDEVTLALMQLVLRTHHLVARGDVTMTLRPQISASREAFLDIVGEASPVPSSGSRRSEPTHRGGMHTDKRLSAAASLLSEAGCRIESDELGEDSVRTVIALSPVTAVEPDD